MKPVNLVEQAHSPSSYCLAISLVYLAHPHFIGVNCSNKTLETVVCGKHNKAVNVQALSDTKACFKEMLLKEGHCFTFREANLQEGMLSGCFSNWTHFDYLWRATGLTMFPFLLVSRNSWVKIERHFHQFQYPSVSKHSTTLGKICFEKISGNQPKESMKHVLKCEEGCMVSTMFICDRIPDCFAGEQTDEIGCECYLTGQAITMGKICKYDNQSNCSTLYRKTIDNKCEVFLPHHFNLSSKTQNNPSEQYFKCKNGIELQHDMVDDFVLDCNAGGEDEASLISLMSGDNFQSCTETTLIPCKLGHNRCYNVSQICSYDLNHLGLLIPCRTGDHLQDCRKFECHDKFKCPGFYCIQWSYVCNGKWDCPHGCDEIFTHKCKKHKSCKNLFQCRHSVICVHLHQVCDGKQDCPTKDDESLCELKYAGCILHCSCLTFSIACHQAALTSADISKMSLFRVIFLDKCNIQLYPSVTHFKTFLARQCNLTKICPLISKDSLVSNLETAHNQIIGLTRNCFKEAPHLVLIDLSFNLIKMLKQNVFCRLPSLNVLNISGNPIEHIEAEALRSLPKVQILSLLCIHKIQTRDNVFQNLSLKLLESNSFQLCCLAPEGSDCSLELPWYQSCTGILATVSIKVALYVVSMCILVSTVVCIMLQIVTMKCGKANTSTTWILSINTSDFLHSVVLMFLWISDLLYKGKFATKMSWWASSFSCYSVYCMYLLFNTVCPVLLFFFALARLMVVKYPLVSRFKSTKFALKCIVWTFTLCILISVGFTILMWFINWRNAFPGIPLTICSPFVDPTHKLIVVKVITWLVAVLQIVATICLCIAYSALILSLKNSKDKVKASVSKQKSDVPMLVQIVIVTGSNILCWMPSVVVHLMALFQDHFKIAAVFWIAIAVTPANSIVNPVVFLVVSIRQIL